MDAPDAPSVDPSGPRRRHPWRWVALGGALAVVALVGLVAVLVRQEARPIPSFPRLADRPDPALTGTVAYTAPDGCIRVVAAAGNPSKEVYCPPASDPSKLAKEGKEAGPQLAWRDDGRLEITMFRWKPTQGKTDRAPDLEPGWQRLVDVQTGEVTEVPAAQVPSEPRPVAGPTTNAAGQRLTWTSDPASGHVVVKVTDDDGTRTLLDVRGPGKYGYDLTTAAWAPSGRWVIADDGRLLVITPGDPPQTRILVERTGMGSGGTAGPTYAVTGADLLGT